MRGNSHVRFLGEEMAARPSPYPTCAVGSIPIARSSCLCMLTITINGEPRQFPEIITVAALVDGLGYTGKRIAIERNGEIVPRGRHADTLLAEGDRLEIVVAVGGG